MNESERKEKEHLTIQGRHKTGIFTIRLHTRKKGRMCARRGGRGSLKGLSC